MQNTAILILAAGGSVRMGKPKLTETFLKTNLLRKVIESVYSFKNSDKLIILGGNKEIYRPQISNPDIDIVINNNWVKGISTSIGLGIRRFENESQSQIDSVMILLADMALVNSKYLSKILGIARSSDKGIIASDYGPSLGPPVIFHRKYFRELQDLKGDSGAKSVIMKHREDLQTLEFPDGLIDIDTPEDLKRLKLGK